MCWGMRSLTSQPVTTPSHLHFLFVQSVKVSQSESLEPLQAFPEHPQGIGSVQLYAWHGPLDSQCLSLPKPFWTSHSPASPFKPFG